ncbi:M10 family metallopeptidase C-terminal domain-containing protein [Neotabrizicola sp. VNH66]|uniref:M10 family metallopeptidase C-terminal domain-containing protein n=1 Tax=Neotabrizicola sp. VNH66 TaxID=3400918 RepID=UPI003BFB5475
MTKSVSRSRYFGNDNNNLMVGSKYDDILIGLDGNDSLYGGDGDDQLNGDDLSYMGYRPSAGGFDDYLSGGNGNDSLYGNWGSDTLFGGMGDDLLSGDKGADQLHGGAGRDTIDYEASTGGVKINLGNGTASGGDAEGDIFSSIENVNGSNYADALTGDLYDNRLSGREGNDTLLGAGGHDTLIGGWGNDVLVGGAGQDVLSGDQPLISGKGSDRFVFRAISDSIVTAMDTITDFHGGTGNTVRDLIDLSEIDANPYRAGNNAFAFIGTGAFTDTRGQLRYYHANGDTIVEADVTGDGVADFGIRLTGLHNLTASDFIL